jgi:hypothetical protein
MDTITLSFYDPIEWNKIRRSITEQAAPHKAKPRSLDSESLSAQKGNRPYSRFAAFTHKKRILAISDKPKRGYKNLPQAQLTAHLSHFRSMLEFEEWLLWLTSLDRHQLATLRVSRLDLCIDLGMDFEDVFTRFSVPQSRIMTLIKSTKNATLYCGGKTSPRRTMLYGKKIKDVDNKNQYDVIPDLDYFGVRIEVKHTGPKVPIKLYGDLIDLRGKNPFKHIKIVEAGDISTTERKPSQKIKIYAYNHLAFDSRRGAQYAGFQLNKDGGNFARTFRGLLIKFDGIDLEQAWTNRCEKFFANYQRIEKVAASGPTSQRESCEQAERDL